MFDLTGKTALVTGAAGGIGFKTAEKLAENGAAVALADVNPESLQKSAAALSAKGRKAIAVQLDVTDDASIAAAIKRTVDAFGGLDILVNSAGILNASTIENMQRGEWNRVLEVNLTGTFFMIQAALPWLKKSPAGRVVNLSSITGRMGGFEGSMCYAASKGGINSITQGMARRLSGTKITVNAVAPAAIETEMLKGYTPEAVERQIRPIPMGRLGKPEEVAAAICYLASDEASFTTGLLMDVNGGAYMG